jgi:hypothetical protein
MYGIRAEMLAYKRIAEASEQQKKWLMELHGVLQDPERIVFVMVSGDSGFGYSALATNSSS